MEFFQVKMEHEHPVALCEDIEDEVEPVWNGVAGPVGGGDDEDIHLKPC